VSCPTDGGAPGELTGWSRHWQCAAQPTSFCPQNVSVQAQILNLLSDLRKEQGVGLVLISHDLNVVSYLTEQAIVMNRGIVVEQGPTTQLLESPADPYTQSLIRSIL
jgi:peptide/nickel transport system ATP-binding protein